MASIKKKPTGVVASLTTPKRNSGTQTFTGTWKVPTSHTSDSDSARATGVDVDWQLELSSGKKPWIRRQWGTGKTDDTLRLNSDWEFSDKNTYNRSSFWPYSDIKLQAISLWVRETNSKGHGDWLHLTREISTPYRPEMSEPEMSEAEGSRGHVGVDIEWTKDNDGYHDADRCLYRVYVTDTSVAPEETLVEEGTTRNERFSLSYDASNRMRLTWEQYIMVRFQAIAQGWRGDSSIAEGRLVVAYPNPATIGGVDIATTDETGKVTVFLDTNSTDTHPTTGIALEILKDTTATTADEAIASADWERSGALDDGECTALAVTVEDVKPSPGNVSWIRIKSWNLNETIFYRYSAPIRLYELETPAKGSSSTMVILSLIPGEDGESAIVHLGWNEDGLDDADGTQLTWATDSRRWKSTTDPEAYEFEWSDGAVTVDGVTYRDSATIHIDRLQPGTLYYVRARRYGDGDRRTYSAYSDFESVITSETPPGVSLIAPRFIRRGAPLPLAWTHDSESQQTAWRVMSGSVEAGVFTPDKVIEAGSDSLGSTVLSADRVSGIAGDSDSLAVAVDISTGGVFVESAPQIVRIADAPVLSMTVPTTLTAQPLSLSFGCDVPSSLAVTVLSQGARGSYPGGESSQMYGDTVWSDVISPTWTAGGSGYTASIALPVGLDMWDGASYTVIAAATSLDTGLSSEPVQDSFTVGWSHQAPTPSDSITVTPIDETVDGFRSRRAEISLAAPTGAASSDVYDVYRVTNDSIQLIAEGVSTDATIVDQFAAYGGEGKAYRVATRTADGDVSWIDYPYEMAGSDLRVDFGAQYIELPWNVEFSDGYSKDFEARSHLGESTPQGYWGDNVSRRASFSTDLIRIDEGGKLETLRDLAKYPGAVFVRTPDGCAFAADVEVSGLERVYNSASTMVALDGVEVAMGDGFMASVPAPPEPEDGE